jgi:divalent metal cation (Fe/Co/Zn/Cd) transporter
MEQSPKQTVALLRRGLWVEYGSVGWMMVESLAALYAGFQAGSFALLAFGGDSFIELISSYAVLAYLNRVIRNPMLTRKEVGAERVELLTCFLLVALLPAIAAGAIYSYVAGGRPESSLLGIAVAAGAVAIMPILWVEKLRIGKEAECLPLSIDAVESATCFFMSVALLGGLIANYLLGIWWVDYIATCIILAFVAKEALESISEVRTEHE